MPSTIDLSGEGPRLFAGPAGSIELIVDPPLGEPRGAAIVAHPHPLLGGDARHKVPAFLARALAEAGWLAIRPNFRGVGRSDGVHDGGDGEAADLVSIADALRAREPGGRLALVGFSFGAFVQARVARMLADRAQPAWRVFLAGLPFGDVAGSRRYAPPARLRDAMVVHGDVDERVPLSAVLAWARPDVHPVVVVPGADHFFAGRLPALQALLLRHLNGTDARS